MKKSILLAFTLASFCISVQAITKQSKANFRKLGVVYQVVEDVGLNQTDNLMFADEYNENNAQAKYHYTFMDTDGFVHALPDDAQFDKFLGKSVEVQGFKTEGILQGLSVEEIASEQTVSAPPIVVQGAYKLLIVVLSLNGNPATVLTEAEARKPIFEGSMSVNEFYKTASFGKFWLTGDKNPNGDVAHVNLNVNIAECKTKLSGDWVNLVTQALKAQSPSIDASSYNGIVTVYPDDSADCPKGGFAFVGTIGSTATMRSWIAQAGYIGSATSIIHEIGHMLGMQHSSGLRCAGNILTKIADCQFVEYADRADNMGDSGTFNLPNVYQRRKLGWHMQPYRQLNNVNSTVNLYSPSVQYPPGKFRKLSAYGQNFYLPLADSLAGNSLYPEARKFHPPFDTFTLNSYMHTYEKGVKLIVGSDDFQAYASRPLILDTTPTQFFDDAPLLKNSHKVGTAIITNKLPATAVGGTQVYISY